MITQLSSLPGAIHGININCITKLQTKNVQIKKTSFYYNTNFFERTLVVIVASKHLNALTFCA